MAGRPSHAKALSLWMNGLRIGEWRIPTRGPMELTYDVAWLAAPEARPLSLSLPLPLAPVPLTSAAVGTYFDNLLPDYEPIRRRIASRFRLADTSAFSLLAEIGRDCVGALQLLPVNAEAPDVRRIDDFSLQLLPHGRYRLAPFYDVLSACAVAGPVPNQINMHEAKLAMSLRGKNRHRKIFEIQRRHFDSTARLCGLDSADALVERILALTPRVIGQAQQDLPEGFSRQVLDKTLAGLADMAARLGTATR